MDRLGRKRVRKIQEMKEEKRKKKRRGELNEKTHENREQIWSKKNREKYQRNRCKKGCTERFDEEEKGTKTRTYLHEQIKEKITEGKKEMK